MASSSRETSIDQHISGLTVSGSAKLFAGTNTTIYNGPVNLRHPESKEQIPSYYEVPNRRVDGFVGREDILQRIDKALSDGSIPRYAGPVYLRHPESKEQIPSYYEVPNRRVDGFVGREDILQRIDKALSDGSIPRYAGPVYLRHPESKEQIPSYYEVPKSRVDGFVGREDILQRIDKVLSEGSIPRYAVLQGMGGQGKSQIALEYCRRKKDSPYSAIFWVDAATESSVKGSFQSISECIRAETDQLSNIAARVAFVLRKFTSWTVQWLMVFDNYDNPDTFLNIRDFIPQSEHGAILFTSRHPDSNALVISRSNHFFELSGLEESAAVALLIQQSQTNEAIPSDEKKIVERLGCHPLAIAQAGAYIRKRKLRLCEFMDHYKREKKIILENTPQLSHYRKRLGNAEEETSLNVFTTWELSFRQLQSKLSENDVEPKLLTLLAFFDEKDISEQLFAGFSAKRKKTMESIKLLIWRNAFRIAKLKKIQDSTKLLIWLNAFRSVEGQWNSDLFKDVLIRLRDSSLLQAFAQGSDGFFHVSLHPLVKDWIRLRTDRSIGQDNTYMAGTLVKEILLNSLQKEHFHLPLLTKQNITSHIIALEDSYQEFFIPQLSIPSKQMIFDEYRISQSWFARFLADTGSYHLSEIIFQRLNAQNQKILGLEHPVTLSSMANLASTYRNQGRWKEAEELEVQVMETRKRVLGFNHLDTLTSMSSLAWTILNQSRWKEAEELDVQVIETRKRLLALEHPDTLTSMGNLASSFGHQGRWKEAEELHVQVTETRKRLQGLEHPSTLTSMGNLARTFSNQGRWKEAEELDVQVTETSSRVLGLEHPHTLTSMGNLARTFSKQGRWKEAEELQVQVMETTKRVLGLEHPNTLTSMNKLAWTFWSLDMKKDAIRLMSEVVQSLAKKIGFDHPNTIESIRALEQWRVSEETERLLR